MLQTISALALAIGAGLFIGLEREKSAYKDQIISLFSLRSYVFFGLGGWLSFYLGELYGLNVMIGSLVVLVLTVIIGYAISWQQGYKPSLTSELSALFTIAIGALAGNQSLIAIILTLIVALDLTLKADLQKLALGLSQAEYLAAIKFLTISAVVLPLLPTEAIDPWGLIKLRDIWLLVVLISAIGFAGYILTKILGRHKSTLLTGILGGLVSSTAVVISLARESKNQNDQFHTRTLAITTIAANAMMYLRILIWSGIIFPSILMLLIWPLLAMILLTGYLLFQAYAISQKNNKLEVVRNIPLTNPLELWPAVKFASLFFFMILITNFAQNYFGNLGLFATAFFTGLADVDAISLQLLRLFENQSIVASVAVGGIMIAVIMNTLVKSLIGYFAGSPEYSKILFKKISLVSLTGAIITLGVLWW